MGVPLDEWSGSKATKELHETISQFVDSSDRQTKQMIRLTQAIVILTVLMFIGLLVQIVVELV